MREVGFIAGPFWVFWTKSWNFTIFGVVIDENNSTGLLITILWCLVLILNLFAVWKEPAKIVTQSEVPNQYHSYTLSNNDDSNKNILTDDAIANGKLLKNDQILTKRNNTPHQVYIS